MVSHMLLLLTFVAVLIVWGMGSFHIWGFQDSARNMLLLFLAIAAALQLLFRAKVRSR